MSKDTFILHEWEKEKMDELTKLAYEEDGHKRGHEQGFEQGLEQGLEQGIEQGIEQGFIDGLQKRSQEIAKNMLNDNLPFDVISKYTNLSHEELEKIKTKI